MRRMTRREALAFLGGAAALATGAGMRAARAGRFSDPVALDLGTAGRGGVFYPLGLGLAEAINHHCDDIVATAITTNGAADNMRLLHEGRIGLALAQADVSWAASQGRLRNLPEKVGVRALLCATSGHLHVVTLDGLGIRSVDDLRGRRVSTGEVGSGTEVKSLRLLDAHGIAPEALGEHHHLDYPQAAALLKEGRLDAFCWDATLPGRTVTELAATPGLRPLLLDTGAAVPAMVAKHGPFYFAASIPAGTYPGIDAPVASAVGKTLFVTHERLPEQQAWEITRAVLENLPEVAASLAAAREITPQGAAFGSSIPFHDGALRYFREKGIAVPGA